MALKIDKSMMNNHNTYVNNKSLANTAANGIEMCSTNKTGKYENAANTNNWYFTD